MNYLSTSSGKRDSNPRPSLWESDALPTELLPPKFCGETNLQNFYSANFKTI